MSALLFIQIVALIVIATVLSAAALVVFFYFCMKLMPKYTRQLMEDLETTDLDAHFGETPDPKFYHPEN